MGGDRISVDAGLALIRQGIEPIGTETVMVSAALGRVLATTVLAKRTVPGFRAAAMDGFAIRSIDIQTATVEAPVKLPVSGRAPAGTWPLPVGQGQACSIGTGAPVPEGADAVVMIEHVTVEDQADGQAVSFRSAANAGLNIRQIGEDAVAGRDVLATATVVTPDVIAGLAAYGVSEVEVHRRPAFALIVTGSELSSDNGGARNPASIVDCNGPMISAYAESVGAHVVRLGTVEDTPDALDQALERACGIECDMVITTGGASHGEQDFVRAALERRKAEIVFHGLSMRPGKPILFARLRDGRPFFGLPGNPISACIGMRFFVAQALRSMMGMPEEAGMAIVSDEKGREGVTQFLRGKVVHGDDGRVRIDTSLDQRSHVLSSLMAADTWLRVERDADGTRHLAFPKQLAL